MQILFIFIFGIHRMIMVLALNLKAALKKIFEHILNI